ncbi:UNVERIFIED_CONTAM: hypothetical protein GTU68_052161, partial [Idotea baltica]|nr:hypothetical protein [Idotea baltica]
INGERLLVDTDDDTPLLWVIRDILGLTGTKFGCGIAQCGACTVHIDGKPVRSCVLPISLIEEQKITTIESIANTRVGAAVQKAWLENEVIQCGYCQSGQIMSAVALIEKGSITNKSIDQSMSGNICRCATYTRIKKAIKTADTYLTRSND